MTPNPKRNNELISKMLPKSPLVYSRDCLTLFITNSATKSSTKTVDEADMSLFIENKRKHTRTAISWEKLPIS